MSVFLKVDSALKRAGGKGNEDLLDISQWWVLTD
jgi:hypothetical protein